LMQLASREFDARAFGFRFVARFEQQTRTAAIVGSASPRKPSVEMESKSSVGTQLAWWRGVRTPSNASSCVSCRGRRRLQRIIRLPPLPLRCEWCSHWRRARFRAALHHRCGRSTTSPAVILFATASAYAYAAHGWCSLGGRDFSTPALGPT